MDHARIGVLGIGTSLPAEVRKNEWWPESVVAKWMERRAAPLDGRVRSEPRTAGQRAVADAMAALRDDVFHGARERRVMASDIRASDLEMEAARRAIAKADVDPKEIGIVLCNTLAPDYLVTNNACLLHHNLGLAPSCFTLSTEAACNAFMMQLALAESLIASGRARYALLVQTCNISPLLPYDEAHSAWFGDGCAASVVGRVSSDFGVLAHAHRTNGAHHKTIVASVPERRWFDTGNVCVYSADHDGARQSFLDIPDCAADVCGEALASAGLAPADVDVYAPHQPTAWFRRVTQQHLQLTKARGVDTFGLFASMFGANIPVSLELAEAEGILRRGDVVLTFAGGAGLTYSGMVFRWGR